MVKYMPEIVDVSRKLLIVSRLYVLFTLFVELWLVHLSFLYNWFLLVISLMLFYEGVNPYELDPSILSSQSQNIVDADLF